jgi:hypothetical protein
LFIARTALKRWILRLSHARVRPLTYREPMRFETMPSSPKPQACRKMAAPLPAKSISDRRTARETGLSDGSVNVNG